MTWVHPLPKTRRTAARRQPSRIDDAGTIMLLSAVFEGAPPDEPLWPFSPDAFRARHRCLLAALGLPQVPLQGLRGAGASSFYMHTEDAMRTLRRGRWGELSTMNIYLQEAEASLVIPNLSPSARRAVETLASKSAWTLQVALTLLRTRVANELWFEIFRALAEPAADSDRH